MIFTVDLERWLKIDFPKTGDGARCVVRAEVEIRSFVIPRPRRDLRRLGGKDSLLRFQFIYLMEVSI